MKDEDGGRPTERRREEGNEKRNNEEDEESIRHNSRLNAALGGGKGERESGRWARGEATG